MEENGGRNNFFVHLCPYSSIKSLDSTNILMDNRKLLDKHEQKIDIAVHYPFFPSSEPLLLHFIVYSL